MIPPHPPKFRPRAQSARGRALGAVGDWPKASPPPLKASAQWLASNKKGRWIVHPAPSGIGYLKAENANGRHIPMRPAVESRYLLADDLCWDLICRQHRHKNGIWGPGRTRITAGVAAPVSATAKTNIATHAVNILWPGRWIDWTAELAILQ